MAQTGPAAVLAAELDAVNGRAAALRRQLAELAEQQSLTTHDDEHDPEGVTIGYQRAQLQGLLAGAGAELDGINAALYRLRTGSYGTCTRCGADISAQRLEALPATPICITCAERTRRRR